jgi:hypothetical protein
MQSNKAHEFLRDWEDKWSQKNRVHHRNKSTLTPVVLPKNSCNVKGAGMRMGLSASSGISAGIGRTARIECRAEILCSGSSEADGWRIIYAFVGMSFLDDGTENVRNT